MEILGDDSTAEECVIGAVEVVKEVGASLDGWITCTVEDGAADVEGEADERLLREDTDTVEAVNAWLDGETTCAVETGVDTAEEEVAVKRNASTDDVMAGVVTTVESKALLWGTEEATVVDVSNDNVNDSVLED